MILIASDHAGYNLKLYLIAQLSEYYPILDLGTNNSLDPVDYPDLACKLAKHLKGLDTPESIDKSLSNTAFNCTAVNELRTTNQEKSCFSKPAERGNKGILICGSGIGMCMAANRFAWVRAALCNSTEEALLARQHNNANVITLGERLTTKDQALKIIQLFLSTNFSEEARHIRRINKLNILKC